MNKVMYNYVTNRIFVCPEYMIIIQNGNIFISNEGAIYIERNDLICLGDF